MRSAPAARYALTGARLEAVPSDAGASRYRIDVSLTPASSGRVDGAAAGHELPCRYGPDGEVYDCETPDHHVASEKAAAAEKTARREVAARQAEAAPQALELAP